jgi:hypothetical protein
MPPRAKPEVELATQATANTTAKRRFMIRFLSADLRPWKIS